MTCLKRIGLAIVVYAAFAVLPIMGSSTANAAPAISAKHLGVTSKNSLLQEVRRGRGGGFRGGGYRGGRSFGGGRGFRSGGFRGGRSFRGGGYRGRGFARRSYRGGYRRGYRRGRGYRYYDYNPGIYLGLGLLGAYGYNRYYYDEPDYYYYDDSDYGSCGSYAAKRACARRFRSFEWDTCRYTTYSGYKRLCPYVR